MAAKVKPFVGHTVMVHGDWADRVGITTHHRQIDVLAFAANRADLADLCAEVGDAMLAKQLTHPGPRSGVGIGNGWEDFLVAVPEPGRGVYIARDSGHADTVCYRVNDDGRFTALGTWTRQDRASHRYPFVPTRH